MAVSWGVTEVSRWLKSVSLGRYASAFRTEEVDGEILFDLDADGCKELGVKSRDVEPLLEAIADLKAGRLPAQNRDPVADPSFFAAPGSTPTKQPKPAKSSRSSSKAGSPRSQTMTQEEYEATVEVTKKKKKSTWGRFRSATFSRSSGRKARAAAAASGRRSNAHAHAARGGGTARRRRSTTTAAPRRTQNEPLSPEDAATIQRIEDKVRKLQQDEREKDAAAAASSQQELARNTFSRSRGAGLSKDLKLQQAAGKLERDQLQKLLFMMTVGFNTRQDRSAARSSGKEVKPLKYQSANLPGFQSYHAAPEKPRSAIPSFDKP